MSDITGAITDKVIEEKIDELIGLFLATRGLKEEDGDFTVKEYPQGNAGFFFLTRYRGEPVFGILHYGDSLVITRYFIESDKKAFN